MFVRHGRFILVWLAPVVQCVYPSIQTPFVPSFKLDKGFGGSPLYYARCRDSEILSRPDCQVPVTGERNCWFLSDAGRRGINGGILPTGTTTLSQWFIRGAPRLELVVTIALGSSLW